MGDNLEVTSIPGNINKLSKEVLISEVWKQLRKDFMLAGIQGLADTEPINAEDLLLRIKNFIKDAQGKITNWDNLNYRIDIPSHIHVNHLSDHEYALLITYRIILKVWTKNHFKRG